MLNFCGLFFLSLFIILYTFINPFHNWDLKEVGWNTLKRINCCLCRPSNCRCDVLQWTSFLSLLIKLYISKNPFHNRALKDVSWNTLWRGLTALHAGLQTVAAMFSQHSTKAKENSPMNACMCSTNNKNEEPVLFICRLWIRKEEVWTMVGREFDRKKNCYASF